MRMLKVGVIVASALVLACGVVTAGTLNAGGSYSVTC